MDFELTDEQRLIQDTVRQFVDERVLPVAVQNDIDHKLDMELIEGMAELGILGIVDPGGIRRRRARLRGRGARLRGDRARRGGLPDADLRPRRPQLALAAQVRDRGAEAALADPAGEGREARVLRPDRAGRRLGRRVDALDGAPRGRHVRAQRPEELDLLRVGRRPRARLREDRPRRRPQGHQRVRAREGHEGLHDAGHRAQARHLGRLDRRAVLRERRGAGREPDRRGRTGLRDRDALARPGPVHGRRRRRAASSARASSGRSSTRASARRSARRSATTSSCRT